MRFITVLFLLFSLVACSTKHPVPVDSLVTPRAVIDTLNSSVVISLRTADRSITVRGMLVYRRPDQLRLVMLSPFGTTLFEAFVHGDQITILYPESRVAFRGAIKDLPSNNGFRGWGMMGWLLDLTLPLGAVVDGVVERQLAPGIGKEKIVIHNGLIAEKTLSSGETVRYLKNAVFAGVRLPSELLLELSSGERIKMIFEDVELNQNLPETAFALPLEGVNIRAVSEMK